MALDHFQQIVYMQSVCHEYRFNKVLIYMKNLNLLFLYTILFWVVVQLLVQWALKACTEIGLRVWVEPELC